MRAPFTRSAVVLAAALGLVLTAIAAAPASPAATSPAPRVLRVGSWNGIPGSYTSIQAAVDAARPGDWILVGPGDYHESGSTDSTHPAGVLITTPGIYLRGMDRNDVVVDGTKPGSPGPCPSGAQYQSTPSTGWSGIEVYKASDVWVQNLSVCNYLTNPKGEQGNEIWWNGGDGDPTIGMGSYWGDYLTATSTYSNVVNPPFGDYGIFASKASGPGVIDHSYASNMGDAGYYIGCCQTNCNAVGRDARAQYNALAYSGTDSGGSLVIEHSEFVHNKTGITSDSEHNVLHGNPANGEIGLIDLPHDAGYCFRGNTDPAGLTSDPPDIQSPPYNPCGQPNAGDEGPLTAEVLCATQLLAPCPSLPAASYPRPTHVVLPPVPRQPTMPNPCAGVPANPWCPARAG